MWAPLIVGQGFESLGGICAPGGFLSALSLKWLQVGNSVCRGWRGNALILGRWKRTQQRMVLKRVALPVMLQVLPSSIFYKRPLSISPVHGTWDSCHVLGSEVPAGGRLCSLHPSLGDTPLGKCTVATGTARSEG